MEHAYREITAYSESQELIITLCILLEYEERPPVLLVLTQTMRMGKLQALPVLAGCGIISTYGHSSVGRAQVSKTWCRGFESLCPCHIYRPPIQGCFYLGKLV